MFSFFLPGTDETPVGLLNDWKRISVFVVVVFVVLRWGTRRGGGKHDKEEAIKKMRSWKLRSENVPRGLGLGRNFRHLKVINGFKKTLLPFFCLPCDFLTGHFTFKSEK